MGTNSSWETEHPPPAAWSVALHTAFLTVNFILALFANFVVSYALIRREQIILPSNRLVFNLTGTNFLFSLLVLPFVIASVAEQRWPFGIFWCNFTAFLTLLFGLSSILTLAAIAIDRYYAIVKPMIYSTTITASKSTAMLLWVWIQAALCSLPPLLGWSKFEYLDTRATCAVAWDSNIGYTILLLSLCIFLPFVTMATCYCFIFRVARGKCRKIHVGAMAEPAAEEPASLPQPRTRRLSLPKRPSWAPTPFNPVTKAVRTISVVMGAFLVTWVPYIATAIMEATCGSQCQSRPFRAFSTWMMYFSTVVHPIVYGFYNRSIRREIRACLCPPSAKAKKGLPRRNSRRLSFSGSLLEYSPSRFRGSSRRISVEFGRASIDLGSLAFTRCSQRKQSQDSGAVTMESDADAELPFFSVPWFATYWLRSLSSKPRQPTCKKTTQDATTISLPILGAINMEAGSNSEVEEEVVSEARRPSVQPQQAEVHLEPSEKSDAACRPSGKDTAIAWTCPGHSAFLTKPRSTIRRCALDEGIVDDCIVQDIE